MFMVSETDAQLIRVAYEAQGLDAAVKVLRGLFKGLPDNEETRASVRTIAGWTPINLPERPKARRSRCR